MVQAPRPGVMSQASRLKNHGHVQLLIKKENVSIVENVGTKLFQLWYMVNTNMFYHPKYYKELRKRNKSDQVISKSSHDGESERAPGPGLKLQAPGVKLSNQPEQASSDKRQAPGSKLQATSHKLQAPWFVSLDTFENDSRISDHGPRLVWMCCVDA